MLMVTLFYMKDEVFMRLFRCLMMVAAIALSALYTTNALAYSQALLDLQAQGLIDLSLPYLPPVAQTPCPNPGPGRDECIMTTEDGRQVIISSPPLVEGCVEGLVKLRGVWVCRAFLTAAGAALVPSRTGGGGNGGSGGSSSGSGSDGTSGGSGPGGYLGSDGLIHVSPSDSSPTCECRVVGTTNERDSSDSGKPTDPTSTQASPTSTANNDGEHDTDHP